MQTPSIAYVLFTYFSTSVIQNLKKYMYLTHMPCKNRWWNAFGSGAIIANTWDGAVILSRSGSSLFTSEVYFSSSFQQGAYS